MPIVQAGGVDLYYEIHGEGTPLLLISGLGYDQRFWRYQIEALSPYFQVITFDNRGVGRSDKPAGPYTVLEMAEDTARLLESLSIRRAHVVGHALGGFVAQELALNYPGYIERLVLAATSFGGPSSVPISAEALAIMAPRNDPEQDVRQTLLAATAPGFSQASPEVFEELVAYQLSTAAPKDAYHAQVLAAIQYDGADRVHRIDAFTLVVSGEHDNIMPPGNASLLASTLPNAEAFILPGVGHNFPLEAPELTNQVLYEFLSM